MIDSELLRANIEHVLAHLQAGPLASAVVHDGNGQPAAVIIVANDAKIAAKLAAMLPALESRLGVEL